MRNKQNSLSVVTALAVGAVLAAALIAPAGAHVGGTVDHLWGAPGHIKSKATKLFYTKTQSNSRFLNTGETAANSSALQGRNWAQFGADIRVNVVAGDSVGAGGFDSTIATCPAGYVAISGGVDPDNVLTMVVTSSAPTTPEHPRLSANANGLHNVTGWHGAVVNNSASAQGYKVGVVCAAV
jgi:hypothetical protein